MISITVRIDYRYVKVRFSFELVGLLHIVSLGSGYSVAEANDMLGYMLQNKHISVLPMVVVVLVVEIVVVIVDEDAP